MPGTTGEGLENRKLLCRPEDLSVLLVQVLVAFLTTYEGHLIVNNPELPGILDSWAQQVHQA